MKPFRKLFITSVTALAAAALLWSGVAVTNAALGVGPSASAQGTGGSPGRGHRFEKMLSSINPPLSASQKSQIGALRTQMRSENKAAGQQDRTQRRARFNSYMDKIRGILTPAQRTSFDANRAAMRAQRRQN